MDLKHIDGTGIKSILESSMYIMNLPMGTNISMVFKTYGDYAKYG